MLVLLCRGGMIGGLQRTDHRGGNGLWFLECKKMTVRRCCEGAKEVGTSLEVSGDTVWDIRGSRSVCKLFADCTSVLTFPILKLQSPVERI